MDGDIAPLPALVEVAERHGAIMMIDDAHASGVLGKGGAGTVDHFGLHGRVDVQVGTLSKAIGVLGGFIAGPRRADRVAAVNRGRPYLFSTSAPRRRSRRVHRGARHHRRTSPSGSSACGRTAIVQGRAARARVRYRCERDADHAGDHRGRGADAGVRAAAVRGGGVLPGDRVPHGREGLGSRADDRHRRSHGRGPRRGARDLRAGRRELGLRSGSAAGGPSTPPGPRGSSGPARSRTAGRACIREVREDSIDVDEPGALQRLDGEIVLARVLSSLPSISPCSIITKPRM